MRHKTFAGIDYFRLIAAFMVIAIHTSPLSVWNEGIDFLITYCVGRIAVPFFFMTTGYFVLAPYVFSNFKKKSPFHKYLVKNIRALGEKIGIVDMGVNSCDRNKNP